MIEPLIVSASVVGLAEIGDRTQFLSLALACRYRRPIPIICGVILATLISNVVATVAGQWIGNFLVPSILKWILVISFIGMAVWAIIPEKSDIDNTLAPGRKGPFMAAFVGFLIAEMGDKTQIATAALAAHFDQFMLVIIGSALGMIATNVPVIIGGHCFGDRIMSSKVPKYLAAVIFLGEAILTFFNYSLL